MPGGGCNGEGVMKDITLKGRSVFPGSAEGEAIVLKTPFSFLGDLSAVTGKLSITDPEINGRSVKDKILVCPGGKGSSGGPTIAWLAKEAGNAPKAIVCTSVEPVLALGVLTAEIPAVDMLDDDPVEVIATGDYLVVDADKGTVKIIRG